MKEEKNHVGRPTNEEVKERKRKTLIKVLVPLILIIFVIGIVYTNINGKKLKGASSIIRQKDTKKMVEIKKIKYTPFSEKYAYKTKKYTCNEMGGTRYTDNLSLYRIQSSNEKYIINIDPGKTFLDGTYIVNYMNKNNIKEKNKKYQNTTPSLYILGKSCGSKAKLSSTALTNLKKIMSCYDATAKRSAMAAQILAWEIVSGERTNLSTNAPNNKLSNGLYQVMVDHKRDNEALTAVYDKYIGILNCARRFNVKPANVESVVTMNLDPNPNQANHSKYYNDNILPLDISNKEQKNLYMYYRCSICDADGKNCSQSQKCTSKISTTKVNFTCNSQKCTAGTSKSNINLVVKFTYSYKNNGNPLNTFDNIFYTKENSSTLMIGSAKNEFSIRLRTVD